MKNSNKVTRFILKKNRDFITSYSNRDPVAVTCANIKHHNFITIIKQYYPSNWHFRDMRKTIEMLIIYQLTGK